MTPRIWLLSDDLGGLNNGYDRIMGNLVRGSARVNVLYGHDGYDWPLREYLAESYEQDWRVLRYFEPEFLP